MKVSVALEFLFLLAALVWPCAETIYERTELELRKVVSEATLLFQTELYYNPRNIHRVCHSSYLECCTSRKSGWLTPVSIDNEIKLDSSSFIAGFETMPEESGLLSSN
ncbi:PREDICTED: oocyte-secreted protein 2 [Hipposideros armiger]|uniref:Oocyte-secreted protein 2 n=1 Tax=Hipposideros armiger TaxID=186990 RepID=A0A8B7SFW7_HIPAR|nr:PREDICTED: oocyte-secreted protein 2 [Hipposideros armiger]